MENLYHNIKVRLLSYLRIFHLDMSFLHEFVKQKKNRLIKFIIPFCILLVGFFSCSYSHRVIHQNIQSIFAISNAIRTHFMDKPGFWGLNTDYLLTQKIIPEKFIKGKKIVLKGGLELLVGSGIHGDTVMPLVQNFDIIISGLNRAQCISYAENQLTDEQKLALISITIVNNQGSYTFEWGGKFPLPVAQYATKQLCQDKGNELVNH